MQVLVRPVFLTWILYSSIITPSLAGLLSEPVTNQNQPLVPGDNSNPTTVPAYPVQTQSATCHLDLSAELFGGVNAACGRDLDRSRCCPVLAAWLFAAHARSALQIPSTNASSPAETLGSDQPMMPDDSQKCVNSLQSALISKNVKLQQPNATCDTVLCFCGIRLHQITSLSCPAAFNVSSGGGPGGGFRNATPTLAVRNLEKSCKNSSYSGCSKCLGALQKLKASNKTDDSRSSSSSSSSDDRASKMFNRDCQLMGLTWLLARNKTEYIPTVSAVLRAIMYSAHPPQESKCSPDQENMPLAVDSLQIEKSTATSSLSQLSKSGFFSFILLLLHMIFILVWLR